MFKYKVCLNFKKNTGLISQDLKINNKEKSADKQITVEKIMLRNSGISIFFKQKYS